MDLKLKGKNVLLYGGHSNIGRAVSCAFAMEGAALTIACRDTETGEKVAKEALERGALRANVVKCDATSYEETKNAADYALSFGELDVVYHGVSFDVFGDFFELDRNLWDKIYEVNFKAEMNAWHYIIPIMVKQGHGSFINCGSTMGRMHATFEPVYGALKAGLIHLCQTIAMDVGKHGVRMNIIAPGPTPPDGIVKNGADLNAQNLKDLSCETSGGLPVHGRWKPVGISRVDPLPVVVNHNVPEYNRLDLLHGQPIGMNHVELFLLQGSKEALHSGVVITAAGTAHTLDSAMSCQNISEFQTGELTSSVTVQNHAPGIL